MPTPKQPIDAPPGAPWNQQRGESDRAYAAFRAYRDLGPGKRSLDAVASQLGRARGGSVRDWTTRWAWVERARAWDAKLETEREEAAILAVQEDAERIVGAARGFQQAGHILVEEILRRAREDPDFLRELSPSQLLGLTNRVSNAWTRGVQIERLVKGEATERVETTQPAEEARRRGEALRSELASMGIDLEALERRAAKGKGDEDGA